MKIRDLDNQLVTWKLSGISSKDKRAKSSLHEKCRELVVLKHPTIHFLEEVSIPIRRGQTTYFDFYIPLLKTAIEVQGEQHYKLTPRFHNSASDFIKQKQRDNDKIQWCEINGIELIILAYNNMEEWESLL